MKHKELTWPEAFVVVGAMAALVAVVAAAGAALVYLAPVVLVGVIIWLLIGAPRLW